MTPEELLNEYIISKYKSIKAFANESGLPYTTVRNIMKRGMMNCGVDIMIAVTRALNIDLEQLVAGKIVEKDVTPENLSEKERRIVVSYRTHPDMQKAVDRLLQVEPRTVGDDIAETISAAAAVSFTAKSR